MADLGRRFGVSQGLSSKIVGLWIDVMAEHCKSLVPWLPRDTIQATFPQAFRGRFQNTTCIVDCSESVLQKAKNLDSRSASYNHYYASNTVKYLIAVAPCGLIMFISDAYGGRCSDEYITRDTGFLDYLIPGDEVMGDGGFTIWELLEERRVTLVIPAFTRRGGQLTNEEVTNTRRIANIRIHVERTIRRLKV